MMKCLYTVGGDYRSNRAKLYREKQTTISDEAAKLLGHFIFLYYRPINAQQ
jgi:hypothetical protein